ncbi:hypothetical protein BN1110_05690 [bacterium YEK0313]|nr:hypothetical protein BN1110_05690 [bacterium YEK0313]
MARAGAEAMPRDRKRQSTMTAQPDVWMILLTDQCRELIGELTRNGLPEEVARADFGKRTLPPDVVRRVTAWLAVHGQRNRLLEREFQRLHKVPSLRSEILARAHERAKRAFELRKAGLTYAAIGKELGLGTAHAAQLASRGRQLSMKPPRPNGRAG